MKNKLMANQSTRPKSIIFILTGLIVLLGILLFRHPAPKEKPASPGDHVKVSEDGVKITFPQASHSLDLIKTVTIKRDENTTRIVAPARIVMSVISSGRSATSILFESSEITSMYSQYRQSIASLDRAQKNFRRMKDMFNNQLATSRDLSDAEGDFLSAQAVYGEFDVKLRAEGFNPSEVSSLKPGTNLVIADVPESQLEEAKVGEKVDVTLSSFQDKVFSGKVLAVGDIIDPVTRTVKVRVVLDEINDNRGIRPGMFGKVDFGYSQNSVNIPISSIVTVEEQNYVFVALSPFEFERRPVTIVNNSATDVMVLSGLSEGESIVVSGAMLLKGLSFGY